MVKIRRLCCSNQPKSRVRSLELVVCSCVFLLVSSAADAANSRPTKGKGLFKAISEFVEIVLL